MISAGSSFCELIRPIPSSLLNYEEEDSSEEEMESAGTAFQRIIANDTTDACEIIVSTLNPYRDTSQKVCFEWALSLSKSTVKEGFLSGYLNLSIQGILIFDLTHYRKHFLG